MSERDVLELIDRAAHEAPTMHVDADQVLAGGRRKVRRRATSVAGMTVGGLALAGAAWLGLGGDGLLGGASEIAPAQTTWEVTQDERVPLGPEGEVLFSGGTRVGDLVLVARPDGSSRLEGSVDGRAVSADGQDAVGGRAVAYDLGPVSVLLHPAVDVPVTLVLGDARESQGHGPAQVGGSSVDHQIMVGREVGADDVLYLGRDTATTLSGQDALQDRPTEGLQVWSVPGLDRWGAQLDEGTGAQPGPGEPLLMFGTDRLEAWVGQLPAGATAARLVDPGTGEVLATAEWLTRVGDDVFAGGELTADQERIGGGVELGYQARDGAWVPAAAHVLDERLALPGGSEVTMSVHGTDMVATAEKGTTYRTALAQVRGGPLLTTYDQGGPVVLVRGWMLGPSDQPRIGARGPDGQIVWTAPHDVALVDQSSLGEEVPLVAVALSEPPPDGELVVGTLHPDGSVRESPVVIESALAGLTLALDDQARPTPQRDGRPLARTSPEAGAPVTAWRDVDGWTVVVTEAADAGDLVPVMATGEDWVVEPEALHTRTELTAGDRTFVVARLRDEPVALLQEQAGRWRILDAEEQAEHPLDGGLAVVDPRSGLWLLVPTQEAAPSTPQISRGGHEALWYPLDDDTLMVAALVVDQATADGAQLLLAEGARSPESGTAAQGAGPGLPEGPVLVFFTVDLPAGQDDLAAGIRGIDTDGDGVVDVRLASESAG